MRSFSLRGTVPFLGRMRKKLEQNSSFSPLGGDTGSLAKCSSFRGIAFAEGK